MIRVVVGLGNPGPQYRSTPHNVGFDVLDRLARRHGGIFRFERRFEAEVAEIPVAGQRLVLMCPTTYMNLSGRAVAAWRAKNGGEPEEFLAVCDDVHLPLGRLRLRHGGSHGGHKGLLSLIQSLGTLEYPRLRMGVKPPSGEIADRVDFVLRAFHPDVRADAALMAERAADAVEVAVTRDFATAMNKFNAPPPAPPE